MRGKKTFLSLQKQMLRLYIDVFFMLDIVLESLLTGNEIVLELLALVFLDWCLANYQF